MARVEMMDVLVAMAKAVLEVAGETAVEPAQAAPKAEKPAKKEKTEKVEKAAQKPAAEDTGDVDLESKTTKELYQMCIDAGIQVPKYGKNKAFYIEALQGGGAEAPATEPEDEDEAEDEYAGKTAKELFELCKKRGIKAAPKKKADVYIDLLRKADEEAAAEEADEEDDWGDEEPEEEKPTKKQSAKPKAAAKKAPAKAEEDNDDDWDI